MRLDPHVLGLIAGTLIAVGGCAPRATESTSSSTTVAAGSETSDERASSENGSSDDSTSVVSSDETSTDSTIVHTSQNGISEEDYPPPCGRG